MRVRTLARLPRQGLHPPAAGADRQPRLRAERARGHVGATGRRRVRGEWRRRAGGERRDDRPAGRAACTEDPGRKEWSVSEAPKDWRGRFYEDFTVGDV